MLPSPATDFIETSDLLGQAWAVGVGEPIIQYLEWSDRVGMFSLISALGSVTDAEISRQTDLTPVGVDALIPILISVKLLVRKSDGSLSLTLIAKDYMVRESPYYVGPGLFLNHEKPLPQAYTKVASVEPSVVRKPWDLNLRMGVQHSRNFAPSVVASRTGEFDGVKHLVDIGGGSGVLSIPLSLDRADIRITLVELAGTRSSIMEYLKTYKVQDRVNIIEMNALEDEWAFQKCDGIYFGNMFHFNSDTMCYLLCNKSFSALPVGGKIFLHEVVFDESKGGPLLAALWNAIMLTHGGGGRQRTTSELFSILRKAGFVDCQVRPTALSFSLITATKA